jgi:glycosyltransferase involved in cell wall biosynthesis
VSEGGASRLLPRRETAFADAPSSFTSEHDLLDWKAMRIALTSEVFLPKIDGITNRLANTTAELVRQGHEVLLFAPAPSVAEHAGARVVAVPSVPFPPYPGLRAGLPDPRIALELQRFRPQVLHAVGPACLGIWGMLAARALRIPVVASYHTDLPAYLPGFGLAWTEPAIWPLLRRVHNAAVLNLCPSRHTQRELRAHGIENVDLWRGGVDTNLFHPGMRSLQMRFRLAGGRLDRPVVLYVGRLSPEKGLEVLGRVAEAVPGVRLALVGDGPARAKLERELAGCAVQFLGFLRGDKLAAAFASADVFVMPSTSETLGFVVLEAMSAGLPVVAARAGGIPDLVSDGENGILYEPADPAAAGKAVAELLAHPGRRLDLAARGRETALRSSWAQETKQLVDAYRKAIVIARRRGLLGRLRHALVL